MKTAVVLTALALALGACGDDTGDETEERFASCGNDVVDSGEQCDDGNLSDLDGCLSDCTFQTCGDEYVHVGVEQCDGRNLNPNGDFNNPLTCTSLGLDTGTLRCGADCRFDTSACGPAFTPTLTPTAQPTVVTATPSSTATPTPTPNPLCGNMTVEPGETCDDGNMDNNDACPSDCVILPCTPAGTTRSLQVDFAGPPFQDASSITLLLSYPDGSVSLPGAGNDASVGARITARQTGSTVTPNDLDHALRVVYTRPGRINPGRVLLVGFDECAGAPAPGLEEFVCQVVDCANSSGRLDGCTCEVAVP